MSNKCGLGFCSLGKKTKEVQDCVGTSRKDWNGLCAYQDGAMIKDDQEKILLNCCPSGCTMEAGQYAGWNGLCAYQSLVPTSEPGD